MNATIQHSLVPSDYRRTPQFCTNVADLPSDSPLKLAKGVAATLLVDPTYVGFTTTFLIENAQQALGKVRGIKVTDRAFAIAILKSQAVQ